MQPIERYGLVALLFLVVTVVAIVLWDKKNKKDEAAAQSQPDASSLASGPPATPGPMANGRTDGGPTVWDPSMLPLQPLAPADAGAAPALGAPIDQQQRIDGGASSSPSGFAAPAPIDPAATLEQPSYLAAAPYDPNVPQRRPYVVRKGDTLAQIAKRELGASSRWTEIAALNPGLDPSRLKVGAPIALPTGGAPASLASAAPTPKSAPVAAAPKPASTGRKHTVKAGETLWMIAESQLGSGNRWREITAANPGVNTSSLKVGMVLALPAGSPKSSGERVASSAGSTRPSASGASGAGKKGKVK